MGRAEGEGGCLIELHVSEPCPASKATAIAAPCEYDGHGGADQSYHATDGAQRRANSRPIVLVCSWRRWWKCWNGCAWWLRRKHARAAANAGARVV